jgi:hypothetical protein
MFKSKYRPGGVLKQGLLNFDGQPYDTILSFVVKSNAEIHNKMVEFNKTRNHDTNKD